jgi:hypothetical protein
MTEREWQLCNDPDVMLEWLLLRKLLNGKASERKLRLLACAACRQQWGCFLEHSKRVIEVVERYTEDQATHEEVRHSLVAFLDEDGYPRNPTLDSDEDLAWRVAARSFGRMQVQDVLGQLHHVKRQAQAQLVREIFGNPLRPARVRKAWLRWNDRVIPTLAQQMYQEREYEQMPVLGDALEDAGCTDAGMLQHCRQPGKHVRGCWVVDLILNKQ